MDSQRCFSCQVESESDPESLNSPTVNSIMNVHYSAAHSGSALLSAAAYYRLQEKTRATPNRSASYKPQGQMS